MKGFWADLKELLRYFRARRQVRAILAEQHKLKAGITSIGTITRLSPHFVEMEGWMFDCSNGALPNYVDERGVIYFCGYSYKELFEIHARRSEFCDAGR